MPFVATAAKQLLVGSFDATSTATGVDWGVDVETRDRSTLADNTFRQYVMTLRTLNISFPGFNDYDAAAWATYSRANMPSEQVVSLAYNGTAALDPVVAARGLLREHQMFNASVGEIPAIDVTVQSSQKLPVYEGLLTRASGTNITGTTTTTPVQVGALTSTQTVAAAIHILTYGGTGTLTFQLQSAATSGGSYTNRGSASSALSAVGGTWLSATGLTVTDTWWRLNVTASASPVAAVFASIGIITP